MTLSLIPITQIHLQSNRYAELGINGDIKYVYLFGLIAALILTIAGINFMNLSTASSLQRAREIGVRKVLGSSRKQLIAQFLFEAMLITFFAAVLSFVTIGALMPLFSQISETKFMLNKQTLLWVVPFLIGITALLGLFSGSYPAFYLSSLRPIRVLKGKLAAGKGEAGLRSSLVIFQFSGSIFLIIATLIVNNQLRFIQNKSLGYDRNQVLTIKNLNQLPNRRLFKQEVKKLPGVLRLTIAGCLPTGGKQNPQVAFFKEKNLQNELWPVDEDYIPTMGMKMASGRNFSAKFSSDSSSAILNESAARSLGYKTGSQDILNTAGKEYHIIGVVKDFNFNSLKETVAPLVMIEASSAMANLSVKIAAGQINTLLPLIKSKWKAIAPSEQFEYSFMDQDFDALYKEDQRLSRLLTIFTGLTILIACLGLFGLVTYAAEQRKRELSIRKVLGASIRNVVSIVSTQFLKLILVSILIAFALGWFAMNKWLEQFAYRTPVEWWVFVVSAGLALFITLLTISYTAIKAGLTNPIDNIRAE